MVKREFRGFGEGDALSAARTARHPSPVTRHPPSGVRSSFQRSYTMSFGDKQIDPDDFFAETRMSFGEHLDDLRTHLWRAFTGFFVAVFISFFLGKQVLAVIAAPVEQQLGEFHARRVRQVAQSLRENNPTLKQKNLLTPQE